MRKTYKRLRSKTRRNTRRHTKNCKRYRKRGGNYNQFTDKTVEGSSVSNGTMVSLPGMPVMSLDEFEKYRETRDVQGSR
jgi:hypothetical protein